MTRLRRRNFLPTFIVTILLWISFGLIVFSLDSQKNWQFDNLIIRNFRISVYPHILLFFFTLTLSLTLTLALLFSNTRRGFLASLFIVSVLLLKLLKFFHWWLIPIFLLLFIGIELVFITKHKKQDNKMTR